MPKIRTALSTAVLALVLPLGLASTALAQNPPTSSTDYGLTETVEQTSLPRGSSPTSIAAKIINTMLGVIGVILVVLMLYAGFLWMTAAGNEEKVRQAQTLMRNAAIGLIIVFAAFAISTFVIKALVKATK